jgi:hypothetical protein
LQRSEHEVFMQHGEQIIRKLFEAEHPVDHELGVTEYTLLIS